MNSKVFDDAQALVSNYTKGIAAVGLLPLPLVDLVVISAAQLKMLQSLAKMYGFTLSDVKGKALISSLLGSAVPLSLRANVVSVFKGLPVVGALVGGVSMSALSATSTYAIGRAFILHFESGGTLLTYDPEKIRQYYQQQLHQQKKSLAATYIGVKP